MKRKREKKSLGFSSRRIFNLCNVPSLNLSHCQICLGFCLSRLFECFVNLVYDWHLFDFFAVTAIPCAIDWNERQRAKETERESAIEFADGVPDNTQICTLVFICISLVNIVSLLLSSWCINFRIRIFVPSFVFFYDFCRLWNCIEACKIKLSDTQLTHNLNNSVSRIFS